MRRTLRLFLPSCFDLLHQRVLDADFHKTSKIISDPELTIPQLCRLRDLKLSKCKEDFEDATRVANRSLDAINKYQESYGGWAFFGDSGRANRDVFIDRFKILFDLEMEKRLRHLNSNQYR